ncbi:MAG: hypothetical protein NZ772_07990 [Cyanobacteria bacterium]|nr:hypothetical protein [Cyanobacteriota bacterium]MDW8201451.1 hypothetical protein [Cyanobacteriota bacterium SKYGB_h_bin112]
MVYDDSSCDRLKHLNNHLQVYLQARHPVWVDIRCAVWKQHLVILGIHRAEPSLDQSELFAMMARALAAIALPLLTQFSRRVQLCLKVAGQSTIYATYRLQIGSSQRASTLPTTVPYPDQHQPRTEPPLLTELPADHTVDRSHATERVGLSSGEESSRVQNSSAQNLKSLLSAWRLAVQQHWVKAISMFSIVLGATYLLTRPCVVGSCPLIQASYQTNRQVRQSIRQATTKSQLEQAQSQLLNLMALLRSIPPWSPHYSEASRQLQAYQAQADNLEHLVTALTHASLAHQQVNPPHSVAEWAQVRSRWQQAINQLVQIPPDSVAYPLAAAKLPIYRAALATTNHYYKTEQRATEHLAEAKRIAQVAAARQALAQNPESWHVVTATWARAITQLQGIPNYTLAYRDVSTLLRQYQQQAAHAQRRYATEVAMEKLYRTATDLGEQARQFQQQQQWSEARQTWQTAISQAQQIPADSFYHASAQALIHAYKGELDQAEQALRTGKSSSTDTSTDTKVGDRSLQSM